MLDRKRIHSLTFAFCSEYLPELDKLQEEKQKLQQKSKTDSLGRLMKDLKVGDRSTNESQEETGKIEGEDEDQTEEGEGELLDRHDMDRVQSQPNRFASFGAGKRVGGALEDGGSHRDSPFYLFSKS